jgi:hypothetical protein
VDKTGAGIFDNLWQKRVAYVSSGECEGLADERTDLERAATGGKATIIRRLELRDRAVRIAGHRSLSAETIRAMSEADAAASATSATAMLTSVSFSS